MILLLSISGVLVALTLIVMAIGIKRSINSQPLGANERLAVFRDRKQEIEADQLAKRISAEDANQAIDDLSVQLEREAQDLIGSANLKKAPDQPLLPLTTSWPWVAAMLSVSFIVAAASYNYLGAPELTEPSFRQAYEKAQAGGEQAEANKAPTQEDIAKTIDELKKLSLQKPDDPTVWGSLGRANRMANNADEAVKAYAKAKSLGLNSPDFLVDYAESIASSKKGDFSGLPVELLGQALTQNPDLPKGIALMGAAQYRLGNFAEAKKYLLKTLAALPPGSDQAKAVQGAIDQISQNQPKPQNSAASAASEPKKLTLISTISLSPALIESMKGANLSQAAMFVAVRSPQRPMPIAARKIEWANVAAQLQKGEAVKIDIDSSHLLAGGSFDEQQDIIIAARISQTGSATRAPGDLSGSSATFQIGKTKAASVQINQANP
jgi:cytochrome c-type biogenesis protein CcmH